MTDLLFAVGPGFLFSHTPSDLTVQGQGFGVRPLILSSSRRVH